MSSSINKQKNNGFNLDHNHDQNVQSFEVSEAIGDNSDRSSSSSASDMLLTVHEKILLEFKKSITWPLKTEWPGLVGDVIERAEAIIKFGTPYYVVFKRYDKLQAFIPSIYDCLRVTVYLDKDNYVAVKPKVG